MPRNSREKKTSPIPLSNSLEPAQSGVIPCYGNFSAEQEKCRNCNYAAYCRGAVAAEQQGGWPSRTVDFAVVEFSEAVVEAAAPVRKMPDSERRFTRDDLLEVISFMVCMDRETLKMLDATLADPTISFAELAGQRKVSRQAVQQYIRRKCEEVPELASALHIRQNKLRQGGTNSFMEAVWQIRRQMSERRSKERKSGSKCSGTLTSLMRNLDLSRLSIYSGGRNCASD